MEINQVQKDELIQGLLGLNALKYGDFPLKNGETTNWYVDLRSVFARPDFTESFAKALSNMVDPDSFDLVCGVPYGALPFATLVSQILNKPLILLRKENKGYGQKPQIEGLWKDGQRCLIVEDVITTGSSVNEAIEQIIANGLRVSHVVVCVDRQQGAREHLSYWGLSYEAVLTLDEIAAQYPESSNENS